MSPTSSSLFFAVIVVVKIAVVMAAIVEIIVTIVALAAVGAVVDISVVVVVVVAVVRPSTTESSRPVFFGAFSVLTDALFLFLFTSRKAQSKSSTSEVDFFDTGVGNQGHRSKVPVMMNKQ